MAHPAPSESPNLPIELLRRAPKVVLHEHLDGGLRPGTILELAGDAGYAGLPAEDEAALAEAFHAGARRGSLAEYLEGFRHTIAVMQTAPALERVAREFVEDMATDGVVYAEARFAPHFHTAGGLGLDGVMTAVLRSLRRAGGEHGVGVGLIVCAMRNEGPELSTRLAELAVAYRNAGCVGFDLAGEEAGHPANHHLAAFQLAKRKNFSITIHAGESFGPESIWQALQYCGAHRIGHGVRLAEDITIYDQQVVRVGELAQYVLDHRIPLEICLSSNVHTGAAPSLAEHPFPYFFRAGYRVTLNTDNRLMSATDMTSEVALAVKHYGLTLADVEKLSINGMKSAFVPYGERCRIIYERIKPGFSMLREELGGA
ncbi:MAG: adenosine deaminase [Planctomycetes bacterium]|jgi:adenosine deaminase|nr:adenosine deaminase [Planctomycetota bacterium]MDP6409848.1 adenosine deaminase [Planctomycetota bacterium]